MKKLALAIAATGLSTGVIAGPLDYNYITGSVDINDRDTVDSEVIVGVEGNKRFGAGLFVGGHATYFFTEGTNGEELDHYTVDGEVGYALQIGDQHEVAGALGYFYADFTDVELEIERYEGRLQYSYNCDTGRVYEAEYLYQQDADDSDIDADSVRISVEGGDRNTWRYDVGYTRGLEAETNGLDAEVIFPLTPQDQGELVIGMEYTNADDTDVEGHNFTVGYRWNLD